MKRLTFLLFVLLLLDISLSAFHCHEDRIGCSTCLLCMVSLFLPASEPGITDSGINLRPDVLPFPDSSFLPAPPGTKRHLGRAPPGPRDLLHF